MPDFRPVSFVTGLLLVGLSVIMAINGIADVAVGSTEWHAFVYGALLTGFIGGALAFSSRTSLGFGIRVREAFLITTVSWLAMAVFAALPFFLRGGMSFTDAFFESMSGLTTTGSTVMTDLDGRPPGILLWRSLLQWVGGVGIIVMAILILPFLRVGGMQLFRTESSDRAEKVFPRPAQLALYIGVVYFGLTAACAVSYAIAGMSPFDAINHAMTSLSTGGYSTHDASFGYFRQPALHWISGVFMAAGALPFVLYIKGLKGNWRGLLRDPQTQGFLGLIATATALLAGWLWLTERVGIMDAVRHAFFNVVSIVTTTGFASADYGAWGAFPTGAFLLLTFVGGCTGSTAGGLKIFRFQVLQMLAREQLRRLVYPNSVIVRRYDGRRMPDDIMASVMAYFALFLGLVAILTLGLCMLGLDIVTAFSGAATAVANVGPGLGAVIGPAGNFATLPDGAKWLLSAGMLLGRLEIFTVLVIFTPAFWRG